MKRFLFAVVSMGAFAALADYTTYSGGDIVADAFACTTNTRVLFGGSGRTWTLSQDASIHSGGFAETGSAGTPKTVKFDFTEGNHTLTLRSANFLVYNHDVSVDFLGGTWDFNAHPFAAYNSPGGANNRVTLDACSFVNTSQFNGLNNTNSWWQLRNGSSFESTGLFTAFTGSDCTGSLIELSGGSTMTTKDFYMRPSARTGEPTAYQGATFRVTGAGSSFSHGGSSFILGHGYNGDVFEVASNATAAIGYPRFGYSAATRNTGLYVHDDAVLTSVNSMNFGNAGDGTYYADRGGMFVRAERGATVKSGVNGASDFCFGSANNELFVSNATFACGVFLIGRIDGATGNVVRILGPSTSFKSNNWTPLFGNGGQNLVEVGDFAKRDQRRHFL